MPFILRRKLKFSLQRGADLAQELTTGARQLRTNNSVPRTNALITSKQNVLNITITGAEVIFTPQEIAQSARKIQKAQRNSQQFTETQRDSDRDSEHSQTLRESPTSFYKMLENSEI